MAQTSLSAYQEKAFSAFQAADTIKDTANWTLTTDTGRVQLFTTETESGLDAVKLEMTTKVMPEQAWRYILGSWREANDRLQPDLVERHEIIQTYPDDQVLWRQFLRSPVWGIAPRELLLFDYAMSTAYGLFVHLSTSVECAEVAVEGERVKHVSIAW